MNILFTSAGRRVELIKAFRKAMGDLSMKGNIITADLLPDAPAHFAGDVRELVPPVRDPGYMDAILSLCKKHDVRCLIPLIDTELPILAARRDELTAAGVQGFVSSPQTVAICRDKRETHRFFTQNGFRTPDLYDIDETLADPRAPYPLLLKPADGSSSIGVTTVKNRAELLFFKDWVQNPILQSIAPGQEYTLDILLDLSGKVRCVVPRLRIQTRAGEVSKGRTVKNRQLMELGRRVAEALPGAQGVLCLQCFVVDGAISCVEINARYGGGFPLAFEAGAKFPHWQLEMLDGRASSVPFDDWEDNLTMLRYDAAYFMRG